MTTASPARSPSEAPIAAPGDLYNEAVRKEGLQPSPELVERVRVLHAATLTGGLVMRAYHAWRSAKNNGNNPGAESAPLTGLSRP